MRTMKKYAVVIVREETRVVWADSHESAQDVALELQFADAPDEQTTDVRVFEAAEDEPALNGEGEPDLCAKCGAVYTDGDAEEDYCAAHRA